MFAQMNEDLSALYHALLQGQEPADERIEAMVARLKARRVSIYGAGRAGQMLARAFADLGVTVRAFFDRSHAQLGAVSALPVLDPARLAAEVDGARDLVVVGAGTMQLAELIEADIRQLRCPAPVLNGLFLVYLLQYRLCKARCADGTYPDIAECTSYHVKPYRCPIFCKNVERLAREDNQRAVVNEGGSSFNNFGYLLGEVCTLKCQHCLEAVPYLRSRTILSRATIVGDIRKMAQACRFIHRLDLVGGEPFLHPEFPALIRDIRAIEGVGYIALFTNGTLPPSDEICQALKSERLIVTLADYGEPLPRRFRSKVAETLARFKANGVRFSHYSDRYWFDLNSFDRHEVDDAQLEASYSSCFISGCRRMYDGVLYHCPYQCNGIKLGKLAPVPGDSLDIRRFSPEELKVELDRFDRKRFIDACRYCNITVGAKEVQAGRQLE